MNDTLAQSLEQLSRQVDMDPRFRRSTRDLEEWKDLLGSLTARGEDAFTHVEPVRCSSLHGGAEHVTLTVTRSDRANPQEASVGTGDSVPESEAIVTVECPSRFNVSVGWVATKVTTKQYGTMAWAEDGSTVNTVVLVEESETTQSPLVMVTGRIASYGLFQFHLAAGAVIDRGNDKQGTDIIRLFDGSLGSEFMVGGSVSVGDFLFISPMWHFVTTSELSDVVEVGKPLPAGVAVVPVVGKVDPSLALAVTLRVR